MLVSATIRDITGRKVAEAALLQSEARFKTLFETSSDAIWVASGVTISDCNPAAENLFRCGREEIVGRGPLDFSPPRQPDGQLSSEKFAELQSGLEGELPRAFEWTFLRPDGSTFEAEVTLNWGNSPEAVHLHATIRDISERKKAEAALRESEARYKTLFETANDAIVIVKEGAIRDCNLQTEALLGCRRSNILGHSPLDFAPQRQADGRLSAEKLTEKLQAAMNGSSQILEWTVLRPDGTILHAEVSLNRDRTPEAGYVQIFVRDITERKRAEEALMLKTALLEAQSETTIDGILAVDESNRIVLSNRQFALHFGVPDELLGSKDDRVVLEHVIGQVAAPEAFAEKVAYLYSHRDEKSRDEVKLKSGKTLERYSAPLIDSQGRYWGRIWYFRDITERKQAEESLRLFRMLVDQSNDGIQVTDLETLRFLDVNASVCSSLGYTREELLAMKVSDIDPTIDAALRARVDNELRMTGGALFQGIQRRKDGSTFPVEVGLRVVHLDRDYVVAGIRDISERKQLQDALEEANANLRIALEESEEQARDAIKLTELVDILQSCETDEEAYRIIESTLPTTLRSTSGALCMTAPSRNQVEVVATWGDTFAAQKAFAPDDCWALRRGKIHRVKDATSPMRCAHVGTSLPGCYACIPLAAHGETLGVLCIECPHESPHRSRRSPEDQVEALARQASAVCERISLALANLRLREVLRSQSIRDPLTGLFNRRYMEETLERELRRAVRNGESVALLMLDIDHFKRFNDTFGHQAGDTLLRGFGDFLSQRTRGQDVACRFGGEEFVLILSGATIEDGYKRAELLREEIKQLSVEHAGQVLGSVFLSIGVSAFPCHGSTGEVLLRAADKALYRAKAEGRDRVVVAMADDSSV